jgi:hypothetical protein
MKMKRFFKFLTVAAILAAGFTGCSSETPVGSEDPTGVDPVGTPGARGSETYATFKFVNEGAVTKASALGSDGSANEATTIANVRMTFFDSDGLLEFDTIIAGGAAATIKLTSGYKQLYVLTNAPADLNTAIDAVTSISNFNQIYSLDITAGTTADLDKIGEFFGPQVVSNRTDNAGITLAGNVTDTESQDASSPNNITINVQRSVAKVFISQSPVTPPTNKTITLDSAGVISPSPTYQLWNVLAAVKPYQEVSGTQVRSPYYDLPAGSNWELYYARNTTPAFNATTTIGYNPVPVADKSYYITENTPQIPRKGNATYAAIKAVFTPTKNHYVESLNFSELNGGQFTGVKGAADASTGVTFYVLDSLQDLQTTAIGLANKTIFAGTNALNVARKAVYHLLNPTIPQLPTLGEYSSNSTVNAALSAAVWAKYIHVYDGGVAYYRLNIGSKTGNTLVPEVKRNKFYQMNIDNFKTLGSATIDELLGDEDEEITSETYLTVTITIDNWVDVIVHDDI